MGLFRFSFTVLVLAWLALCLILTKRYFSNSLAITNFRVIGKVGDETLESPLDEVKNVFIEQSIWGKLLDFGAIVVSTKQKSLTFKDIDDPERIYSELLSHAENYCHGK